MKKFYFNLRFIGSVALIFFAISTMGNEFPKLTLESEIGVLTVTTPENIQLPLQADYSESAESEPVKVSVKWKVEPGYLGKINRDGFFTAMHPGEGKLIAKYKNARYAVNIIVSGNAKEEGEDESEDEYPKVKIVPGKVKIETGDYVELRGFYINELGEKEDVPLDWAVSNPELGEFPVTTESMFYAGQPGQGFITATYGELSATVKLLVTPVKVKPEHNSKKIIIVPEYNVVHLNPGGTIEYKAILKNINSGETNIEWSVSNESVASIDSETGLLTLGDETGMVIIKATIGEISASAELIVVDPEVDLTVNTITIHRVLPDGTELPPKTLMEGETYKIGGLPYPLNILNAGWIHFPFGCIHENITLYMFIPEEFAQLDDENSEVEFTEQIINGIKFSVQPEGSDVIVEPYNFDIPVNLCLVFKRGLLESLQISPENLDVFFADNTGFTKADEEVEIDIVKNRIYAQIEHFSTIVIREKSGKTNTVDWSKSDEVLNIFPNPFSTTTKIRYHLSNDTKINLTVFNIFGHQMKVLVNEMQNEGLHSIIWDASDESGAKVPTGIYLCRILKNGKVTQVKRIVINR